jgi:hypothetical protein
VGVFEEACGNFRVGIRAFVDEFDYLSRSALAQALACSSACSLVICSGRVRRLATSSQ